TRSAGEHDLSVVHLHLAADDVAEVQYGAVCEVLDPFGVGISDGQLGVHVMEPMWCHRDAETCSGVADSAVFGDATTDCGVGLENVDCVASQQLQVSPTTSFNLTGSHRNTGPLSQALMI